MKCKDCPEGRRFAEGSTYCVLYGMIIRDEHECTRTGGGITGDRNVYYSFSGGGSRRDPGSGDCFRKVGQLYGVEEKEK